MSNFKRRVSVLIAALALFIVGVGLAPAAPVQAFTGSPVVFFTPHQDDEVLSMGAAIRQHVLAGRQVWVVLLTDGGASAECLTQYTTRAACVAERDKEFTAGVYSMGATPTIRSDRMADLTLTSDYVKRVVEEYYNYGTGYKNASFKTTGEYDAHPDHVAAGQGLRAAVGPTDKRFYVSPENNWANHAGTFSPQYNLNTTLDLYPFGKISVPGYFASARYPQGCFSKVYA